MPYTFVEVTKTEDGVQFPVSDYAYVPDAEAPSTWKLRLTATPGGTPDAGIVGAAVAALGEGFRGKKVQIPAEDLPAVKAKVRAAWKKANPDRDADEIPAVIREAVGDEGDDFEEAATFKSLIQRLLKAAHAVADHKNLPSSLKRRLSNLRDVLTQTYEEMPGQTNVGAAPAGATEAVGDTSDGTEEFREDSGALLEVEDE